MKFNYVVFTFIFVTLSTASLAEQGSEVGSFGFEPIIESANSADWDATAPWKLPAGFSQSIVSDETTALNIYGDGCADWHDMNTVNETGKNAGRFMYRTHEVRTGRGNDIIDSIGGTISVVDLKTGLTKILAQDESYTALDGIRWTPWGTLLFAEETAGGRFFWAIYSIVVET